VATPDRRWFVVGSNASPCYTLMMSAALRSMSLEAFLDWESQRELKYEFDGLRPVGMTGVSAAHSRIQFNLMGLLFNGLRGHRCEGLGSDLKIQGRAVSVIPMHSLFALQSRPARWWSTILLSCSKFSESVRKVFQGLQTFRSMSRIDARRIKASALLVRFSKPLQRRRQRLSHAMVRSTIQRLGNTTNPLAWSDRLTISVSPYDPSWSTIS